MAESYPVIFSGGSKDKSPSRLDKYGWYSTLVFVSGNRLELMPEIEKMSCHQVFTYLSYRLDEKKMENDQMKKSNAKAKMKMRK